jgi:hypothetical protein
MSRRTVRHRGVVLETPHGILYYAHVAPDLDPQTKAALDALAEGAIGECPVHGPVWKTETEDLGTPEGRICLKDWGQCQRPVTVWQEGDHRVELEAQCPACGKWSPIIQDDTMPPGVYRWRDSAAGCPHCGYPALAESEGDTQER